MTRPSDIPADMIERALTEVYGPRCPDFDVSCFGCQAWAQLQELKDAPLSAQAEATEAAALLHQAEIEKINGLLAEEPQEFGPTYGALISLLGSHHMMMGLIRSLPEAQRK